LRFNSTVPTIESQGRNMRNRGEGEGVPSMRTKKKVLKEHSEADLAS